MKVIDQAHGETWSLYCGDSAEVVQGLPDRSVDLIVTSPPFSQLYTYSASERDLGNSRSDEEFLAHFRFIVTELMRVTEVGRVACIHVTDLPAMLARDGYIGLKDFSGSVIRLFIACGWIFDSRIPIDKNQQAQSIRTHAKGLTMTQMEKDRTWSRPALPDYILKFRKPGDNPRPVRNEDVTRDQWIDLANPTWPDPADRCADSGAMATWYGIRESDTLNAAMARSAEDERHICPLQIETIERCIRLWSNRDDTVFDPFAGIGSTVYQAVRWGRRGIGIELKQAYWRAAVSNVERAAHETNQPDLFSIAGIAV